MSVKIRNYKRVDGEFMNGIRDKAGSIRIPIRSRVGFSQQLPERYWGIG